MEKRILLTTLNDYVKYPYPDELSSFSSIYLFYADGEGSIPVSSMEMFIGKPVQMIKIGKGLDMAVMLAFYAGAHSKDNLNLLGDACAKVYSAISSQGIAVTLLSKTKKKTGSAKAPVQKPAPAPKVNPLVAEEVKKPRAKKEDTSTIEPSESPKAKVLKKPATAEVKTDTPAGKKITMGGGSRTPSRKCTSDDVKQFLKDFDSKEIKLSDSAMSIFEAFKVHIKEKKPITDALKDILLIDSRVEAVSKIIGTGKKTEPEYANYTKILEFVKSNII